MSLLAENYGLGGFIPRALKDEIVSTFPAGTHEYWMERALQISMNACGSSAPNPAVGCVIVSDGVLIAEGFTQQYRGEHAERMAMNQIGDDQAKREQLKNATVYVTLEPCSHFGSQPPCVDLFLNSPIQTIVIACPDPDSRVNGAGIEKLKAAGVNVIVGVLENEALELNKRFFTFHTKHRPYLILKWAQR